MDARPVVDGRAEKKRRLQACLKEIKQLVGARFPSQPVGSVDALQRVAAALRRSHAQLADELRLAHLPGTSGQHGQPAVREQMMHAQDGEGTKCPTEPAETDVQWISLTVTRVDATVVRCDHNEQLSLNVGDNLLQRLDKTALAAFEPMLQKSSNDNIQLTCRYRRDAQSVTFDYAVELRAADDGQCPTGQVCLLARPVRSLFVGVHAALQLGTAFASAHAASLRCVALSPAGTPALGYVPAELADLTPFDLVHRRDATALAACLLEARCRAGARPPTSKCQWLARARNGTFVSLASEWCVHTNPWTGVVDYVVAKHTVMDVPRDGPPPPADQASTSHAPTPSQLDVLRAPSTHSSCASDTEKSKIAAQVINAFARSSLGFNEHGNNMHCTTVTAHQVSTVNDLSMRSGAQPTNMPMHGGGGNQTAPVLSSMPLMQLTPALSAAAAAVAAAAGHQQHGTAGSPRMHTTLGAYVDGLVEAMVADASRNGAPVTLAQLEQAALLHHSWPALNAQVQQPERNDGARAERANHCTPESTSSSGHLSYTQINCLENVQRLLTSQPRTAGDGQAPCDGRLTPVVDPETQSDTPLFEHTAPAPQAGASSSKQASMQQPTAASTRNCRSHSANEAALPAPHMPLTRDALRRHTKHLEKEYKETYKRRLSSTSSSMVASQLRKASAPNLALLTSASASEAQPEGLKRPRNSADATGHAATLRSAPVHNAHFVPPASSAAAPVAGRHSGDNAAPGPNQLTMFNMHAAASNAFPSVEDMQAAVSAGVAATGALVHSWTISRPNVQISSMPLPYSSVACAQATNSCSSRQPLSLVTRASAAAPVQTLRQASGCDMSDGRLGHASHCPPASGVQSAASMSSMPPPVSMAVQPCRLTLSTAAQPNGPVHQANVHSNVSTEGSQIKEVADALMLLQDT